MSKQTPSHFRMSLNDESTDNLMQESFMDRRIEKLSHRITRISILIPVLIVLILVLAYLDLTKRVIHFQSTGTTEVQALAESLEDRFSSLSVKQAKLEEQSSGLTASAKKAAEKTNGGPEIAGKSHQQVYREGPPGESEQRYAEKCPEKHR